INHSDCRIDGFRFIHDGSIASTRRPLDIRSCERVTISHPVHITDGTPSDASHLVTFDANCEDCTIVYAEESLTVARSGSTVGGSGVNTRVRVDDEWMALLAALNGVPIAIGSWTPTGTGLTNVSAITPELSIYTRLGDIVAFSAQAAVTPTASGALQYR